MSAVNHPVNSAGQQKVSDAVLRQAVLDGKRPVDIAREHGVSRQTISKRVRALGLDTVYAANVRPAESARFVGRQLDAMDQLVRGLEKVNKLMDACDEWLRDAEKPERYDIGARATEIMVTYEVPIPIGDKLKISKERATLQALLARLEETPGLAVLSAESKHADPRELVLKTVAEGRQIVTAAIELARLLADAKSMARLRECIIEELRRAEPEVAERIAESVRRSIDLHAALEGYSALGAST